MYCVFPTETTTYNVVAKIGVGHGGLLILQDLPLHRLELAEEDSELLLLVWSDRVLTDIQVLGL